MNKKAQVEPLPLIMGIFGALLAWVMAGRMEAGIFLKIITTVITAGACYWLAYAIANSG